MMTSQLVQTCRIRQKRQLYWWDFSCYSLKQIPKEGTQNTYSLQWLCANKLYERQDVSSEKDEGGGLSKGDVQDSRMHHTLYNIIVINTYTQWLVVVMGKHLLTPNLTHKKTKSSEYLFQKLCSRDVPTRRDMRQGYLLVAYTTHLSVACPYWLYWPHDTLWSWSWYMYNNQ